ncbi:hypothetical protein ACVI1I_006317 [Bradyrhizobium sp. USDA 4459]
MSTRSVVVIMRMIDVVLGDDRIAEIVGDPDG